MFALDILKAKARISAKRFIPIKTVIKRSNYDNIIPLSPDQTYTFLLQIALI